MREFICARLLVSRLHQTQGLALPDYEEVVDLVERDACIYYIVTDPTKDLTVRANVPAQLYDPERVDARIDDGSRKRVRMRVDRLIHNIHHGLIGNRVDVEKRCDDGFRVSELACVQATEALICINPNHIVVDADRHRPPAPVYGRNRCGQTGPSSRWHWEDAGADLTTVTRGRSYSKAQGFAGRVMHTDAFWGGCDMMTKLNTAYNRKRSRAESEPLLPAPSLGRRPVRFSDAVTIIPPAKRVRI